MAVPILQQQQSAGASGLTTTLTFGGNFTAGSEVVVCIEENDDATGPAISGTGIVFTLQRRFRGDVSHDNTSMWTGVVGAGASNSIVITAHGDLGVFAAIGLEISGTIQVVDGTPPAPTNVVSASPSVTSNTPSQANDYAIAFCGHTDATAPTGTPSSWTALTRSSSTCSIEGAVLDLGGSTTAVTPLWTFAGSTNALLQIVLVKTPSQGIAPLDIVPFFNELAGPSSDFGPNAFIEDFIPPATGSVQTVAGSINMSFTETATVVATKVLAGSSTITFTEAATVVATKKVAPSGDTITFTETASLVATKVLSAATSIRFTEAASLVATKVLSAATTIRFTETAALVATKVLGAVINTLLSSTASITKTSAGAPARFIRGFNILIMRLIRGDL